MKNNPYVGPRPYTRGEGRNFYGRTREARDLALMIMAQRALVFYAESGAGKTSLLNARVIPELETEGFEVLPVARVGSDLPPSIDPQQVDNIFVLSALMQMAGGTPVETLAGHTLLSFLRGHFPGVVDDAVDTNPPILILDQFEEIFTSHQERWQDAQGFFEQLQEALREIPSLGVVFAMREDFVAAMDPYAPMLPKELRARFRMERLGVEGALEAVRQPAKDHGAPFDAGVAERLVDDLRRIRTAKAESGAEEPVLGPFVEPVQLQVVCNRLWDNLPEQQDELIRWGDVQRFGDIDQALTDFYESTVGKVLEQTGVSERRVRRWFSTRLITPMQTRGLVLQGPRETGGMPNKVVRIFEANHLIRADMRAGARWYELVHDRLVEPIIQSNQAWEMTQQTPLYLATQRWLASDKNPEMLYQGKTLRDALSWSRANPAEVEPDELVFLEASRQAELERKEKARARERALVIVGAVIALIVIAVISALAWSANQASGRAEDSAATADANAALARISEANARAAHTKAQGNLRDAWAIQSNFLADLARQQVLAAAPETGLVLALEALAHYEDDIYDLGGGSVLLNALANTHGVSRFQHAESVEGAVWNADESRVLSWSRSGTANVWDTVSGETLLTLRHDSSVAGAAWSADESRVMSWSASGAVWVWDAGSGEALLTLRHRAPVNGAAWSADGTRIMSWAVDGSVWIWDTASGEVLLTLAHDGAVSGAAWNADESRVLSWSTDGTAQVWDAASGEVLLTLAHDGAVRGAAWSADESRVLSWSVDRTVRIWDAVSGEALLTLVHEVAVEGAAWNPDETLILSWGSDGIVNIWDAAAGGLRHELSHDAFVQGAAWNASGTRVLSWSDDRTARVWDAATGELKLSVSYREAVSGAVWSADESRVLCWSIDGTVNVWNAANGRVLFTFYHGGAARGAAWSANESRVLSWSADGTARVWDAPGEDAVVTLWHDGAVSGAVWSDDRTQVLSWSVDGTVRVWDAAEYADGITGRERFRLSHGGIIGGAAWNTDKTRVLTWSNAPNDCEQACLYTVNIWDVSGSDGGDAALLNTFLHDGAVQGAAWSTDETRVLSWSSDGTARVWQLAPGSAGDALSGGAALLTLQHERVVWGARWSAGGARILTWSDDGSARVWDAQSGRALLDLGHEGVVTGAAWNADETRVLTWSSDGRLYIWDASAGALLVTMRHDGAVRGAAWSTDESRVLTWSSDGTARIWDTLTGQVSSVMQHDGAVSGAVWSAGETQVLSWSGDVVRVWSAARGRELLALSHDGAVNGATWNADETRVLSWSSDNTARVWDAETGAVLYILRHTGALRGARCCADSTHVLTWSDDGMVRVWLVDLPALIERASVRAIWPLSNQERDAFYLPTLEPTQVAAVPTLTPLPTLTPQPTSPGVDYTIPTSAVSDWWQVHFTEPVDSSDPALFVSGIDQYLVRAIEGAGYTIDAALFQLDLPSVTEALRNAHGRGVRVRVLTDDEHGVEDEDSTIGQLVVAGIPVVDDGRGGLMYNKFVVIDGREVWTGSWTPTLNGTFHNNSNLIAIVSTGLAAVYTREFEEMFVDGQFGSTSPSFETPAEQSALVDDVAIQAYFAPEDRVIDQVIALIAGAKSSVRFMAFSFTDDLLGQTVRDAADRGVTVDGIVEARGSETEYSEFPAFYCNQLSVRQDGNPWSFLHQVFIIDDEIVVIGSPTSASSNNNDDNTLVIRSPEIAAQYDAEFARRWQEASVPEDLLCD